MRSGRYTNAAGRNTYAAGRYTNAAGRCVCGVRVRVRVYIRLAGIRLAGIRLAGIRLAGIRLAGIRLAGIRLAGNQITFMLTYIMITHILHTTYTQVQSAVCSAEALKAGTNSWQCGVLHFHTIAEQSSWRCQAHTGLQRVVKRRSLARSASKSSHGKRPNCKCRSACCKCEDC